MTLSITVLSAKCNYAECRYAVSRFFVMLSVIMVKVVMLSVILLSVVAPFIRIIDIGRACHGKLSTTGALAVHA